MFLPDLPGFGESTDVAADISVDAYVELVLKAIDEMVGDGEHLDIVGFSFGGQIAAGAAVGLGERARRVALLSPSGFDKAQGRVLNPPRPNQSDPSEEAEREYHRQMLLAVMFADTASADDEAVDIQHYNTDRARLNNRRISRSGRLVSMLKQIRCPVLVIYGDRDAVAYPSRRRGSSSAGQRGPIFERHWLRTLATGFNTSDPTRSTVSSSIFRQRILGGKEN